MKINTFEEILSWQKWQEFAKWIYTLFRNSRDFWFRDQIQRAAVSISNNIAEWFERRWDNEFRHFLYIAKWSCGESRSMLYIARDLNYITPQEFDELFSLSQDISKLLSGLISSIK